MVKRIFVLMIAVFVSIGALQAFADAGPGYQENAKEKTIFQKIADTIPKDAKLSGKNKVKPIEKVSMFQNMSDGIKEGSAKMKNQSLR